MAISTDFIASQSRFAKDLNATFPLASDHSREVSKAYGILMPAGLAARVTFLVDMEGKIVHIDDTSAINPEGALTACKRLKKGA